MSLDISSKLTSNGIKSIYEKLFDSSVSYNKAFFSDENTLLKLRLYNGSSYKESVDESYELDNHTLVFKYKFSDLSSYKITAMRIYNGSVIMMEITDLDIAGLYTSGNINNIDCIELKYTMNESTQCIPNVAYDYMLNSLLNKTNRKITNLYTGIGLPDLSGDSSKLTDRLASYEFESLTYLDNSLRIVVKGNDDLMSRSDITEIGIGYNYISGTDDSDSFDDRREYELNPIITDVQEVNSYTLCTLQSVHYSKINQSDKYIIELLLKII